MNTQNVNKQTWKNPKNLPFTEYYESLKSTEKREKGVDTPTELDSFLMAVAEETDVHFNSVRRWAYGTAIPKKLTKEAIARFLNSDVETLFPETVCQEY